MAEYINVEKPFLEKLKQCGWTVIDQGEGIPEDPNKSMRDSFDEVALKKVFISSVSKLNPYLEIKDVIKCYEKILLSYKPSDTLIEINKKAFEYLRKGITISIKNKTTGKIEVKTVQIINFDDYTQNSYIAINQFKINTPGMAKEHIRPDIVCFVNGLPWIVVECKDFDVAEPLSDAYTQIRRYSNQRKKDDPYSGDEGKEQLFYTNLFNVLTFGTEARFGTITADFDYFSNWADIFPEIYKTPELKKLIETKEDLKNDIKPGAIRQEVIIGGMFNHEILIDIFRNFTLYITKKDEETKEEQLFKVVCRYQQYRAVGKIIDRLKEGTDWRQRSGVIWHTQGSGKSLTMVFLIKKMRTLFGLKDYKILMVVDRLDLEEQLLETAEYSGEKVNSISEKKYLVTLKDDDTPDLNLVMIHKFTETTPSFKVSDIIPKFKTIEELSNSEKILILIDEAHRSQNGDMNDNLFMAFPNATRIGFTGTPLITPRHKIATAQRFGSEDKLDFIDTYKMNDGVKDKAIVDIKYIGMATLDDIPNKDNFDDEFENIFKNHTPEERQKIQEKYGTVTAYLESQDRITNISKEIMSHYVKNILPNGFKAMVVASSVIAAVRFKITLEQLIPEYLKKEEQKAEPDNDLIAKLKILKIRAVVSQQENNEKEYITRARKEGAPKSVRDSFRKDFNTLDSTKSDTGIGILCVCDRLLTGFDAPILQVMYMDRNLREHTLLQAIARVNRTKKGKNHGIVVDFFGITRNLTKALGIYTDSDKKEAEEDLKEFSQYFGDILAEKEELELRYDKIVKLFESKDILNIKDFLEQKISDTTEELEVVEKIIEVAKDLKFRAAFNICLQNYFDVLDLLFYEAATQREHWIRAKRLGYLLYRINVHYKDKTLDLKWASAKVRMLIDKYVKNIDIKLVVDEVKLLSDDFPKQIDSYQSAKSKASAMEHAIRWHIKINLENKDIALYKHFNERLNNILSAYQNNWEQMVIELQELRNEIAQGRKEDDRFKPIQMPFYDYLKSCITEEINEELDNKLVQLTKNICSIITKHIQIEYIWEKADEIGKLQGAIVQELRTGIMRKQFKDISGDVACQLLLLIKNNYQEVLKHINDMEQ